MAGQRRRPELSPDDDLTGHWELNLDDVVRDAFASRSRAPVLALEEASTLEAMLPTSMPKEGMGLSSALESLAELVVPHSRRNAHPGMFGYVCSPGLPSDVPAHALVAALNQNVTSYTSAPGATTVERRLIHWLCELIGLPQGAGGMLASGGSLANFTGMCCALARALGPPWREEGLAGLSKTPTVYLSTTAHFSVERAGVMLGLGRKNLRVCFLDDERRIDPKALSELIARDREAGCVPVCVVASAGATTLGTIDPLDAIADVCAEHRVWLHVDGAYGAAALLAPELRPLLAGIERADSLSFDLHKWAYLGFDASAILLRDEDHAEETFFTDADYVDIPRDPPPEKYAFFQRGPETSRRFRALAPALAIASYGADRLGRNVLHNVHCTEWLAAHVQDHPDLELIGPPKLSICCFRYAPAGLEGTEADLVNDEIRQQLAAEGDFYLSPTMVDGRPVLRTCIISPATRAEHVEALIDAILRIGPERLAAMRAQP
jgi:glutamate/tyrosine decarboxylase-like PLP-dependent enzyme